MKLTKKQKNYLIRIAIVVILAIVVYFMQPSDVGKNGGTNGDTELSADSGDETDKGGQENNSDDKQDGGDEQESGGEENKGSTWVEYEFRKDEYLTEHFEKHGDEFEYANEDEYLAGANKVINSNDALHKTEAEDGDYIYYLEASNEFVVVSKDGYIRTYFKPSAGIDYYNRQ